MDTLGCTLCESDDIRFVKSVKDSNHYLEGQWRLCYCRSCRVHFLADAPNPGEISRYYPAQRYYTHNRPATDGRLMSMIYDYYYGLDRSFIAGLLYYVLRKNINMFPPKKFSDGGYLLDVGCGNGQLLQRFGRYGFHCEGYDVDENALRAAQSIGVTTYSGAFSELTLDQKYGVVILNQVLEHLHDPLITLLRVKELLLENGTLIISVPNVRCVDFRMLRDSWTAFQAPTHLFHHNIDSLTFLLEKAGFRITQVAYASPFAALKRRYLKRNLHNLFRIEKSKFAALLKSSMFLMASLLVFLPGLSRYKRNRITVYCERCTES